MPEEKIALKKSHSPGSGSVDVIIVGQGICGTFLGWHLREAGISFMIIDEEKINTASKAAAGIINPVTGRRIVKTWLIEELLAFAQEAYHQVGRSLDIDCIAQKPIIDFFPSPQMRNAFLDRYEEDREYLVKPADENSWSDFFNYEFGYGEIHPCYLIDVPLLLSAFRNKCILEQSLIEERFSFPDLILHKNKIEYKNMSAQKIIFCDGIESYTNPYFSNLPFALNKGEALIVETENIPSGAIFKKGFNLVPIKENLFWVGSSFEWEFENDQPTEQFRKLATNVLQNWLKPPFRIQHHLASIRPATIERRPFVGFHPIQTNVGILNGMGTKGCSLAPYFANQLTQHMLHNIPLMPQADVLRFAKTLGKSIDR
jgi:glycine/D-amino acid oxidase-like deaminating enzyme